MKEWEKHILSPYAKDGKENTTTTLCGKVVIDWQFTSIDHAFMSIENKDRVVPCKKCLEKVIKVLNYEKV